MLSALASALGRFCHAPARLGCLSQIPDIQLQSTRTLFIRKKKKPFVPREIINGTYILKRKNTPRLHKLGAVPKNLRRRFNIYIEEEVKQLTDPVKVVLRDVVLDVGVPGQVVEVPPLYAHEELLLTGKAVYASMENLERFSRDVTTSFSSVTAYFTQKRLSEFLLTIDMNSETPWVLEKWHVRAAFRRLGVWLKDESITLPPYTIKGPDLKSDEEKNFTVTVSINNKEVAPVQARIRLCGSDFRGL